MGNPYRCRDKILQCKMTGRPPRRQGREPVHIPGQKDRRDEARPPASRDTMHLECSAAVRTFRRETLAFSSRASAKCHRYRHTHPWHVCCCCCCRCRCRCRREGGSDHSRAWVRAAALAGEGFCGRDGDQQGAAEARRRWHARLESPGVPGAPSAPLSHDRGV
jgi:hypothetical protein